MTRTSARVHIGRAPTAVQPRNPMTALDESRTVRYTSTSTGRPTVVSAVSADGVWHYDRTEHPGTPWPVTHAASGITYEAYFGTLDAARAWTATDGAVFELRSQALRQVSGTSTPDVHALRGLRHLTGRTVMPRPDLAPEARCRCGGWLVYSNGEWVHLDVCAWCETEGVRCTGRDLLRHGATCDQPGPAQCDHSTCHAANVLPNECEYGHDLCCGCCTGHRD